MKRLPFAALALLAACGGGTSSSPSASAAPEKTGPVVARVGNDVITADELKQKLDQQSPFVRARYNTLERKKEFLDNQIRFEVLAQEAMRRGMDKDPEVLDTTKKVMVQKLIRMQFDEANGGKDIPDAELEQYYQSHLDDYVKPERVRSSHILFAATDPKARPTAKARAQKLLAEIKAGEAKGQTNLFADKARELSEDPATRAIGGDLRYFSKEELAKNYTPELAEAVFKLQKDGDMALAEDAKGVHLIKLTGRQPALDRKFDEVKEQIRQRLFRERRTKEFDEFVKKLKADANIQIFDEELAKVEPSPAPPGQGGMPGAPPVVPPPPGSPAPASAMPPPPRPATAGQ